MIFRGFPDFSAQPPAPPEGSFPERGWPNAVIHARNKELYYPEHEGPLSIMCNFRGEAEYHVRGRFLSVDDTSYLLLNDGQRFSNTIHSETDVESLHIWFESGFAGRVLRDLVTPSDSLLEEPEPANAQPIQFLEKTYPHDRTLTPMLLQIRAGIAGELPDPGWLEEQFHLLLERLIDVHRGVAAEIDRIPAVRRSTRIELYRRLHVAREFIDAGIGRQLTLSQMARAACLSSFHFLRLFRQIFGQTPHQYLTARRLERARRLLADTSLPVSQICLNVGFSSPASFSGLFRRHVGVSPDAFRRERRRTAEGAAGFPPHVRPLPANRTPAAVPMDSF